MRRLIKSVGPAALYVTLFLVPLFAANVWVARMTENHYEMSFREIYEGSPEYDIIFLGPSHTMHGVHTQYIEEGTGLKAYNFGLDGSNPPFLHSLYRFLLKPLKKRISIVALDTMYFQFEERILWRTMYYDAQFIDWLTLIRHTFSDEVQPAGRSDEQGYSIFRLLLHNKIPLLKYHKQLIDILAGEKTYIYERSPHQFCDRGFVPLPLGYRPGVYGPEYYRSNVMYRPVGINQKWVQVFEDTIRELQEDGVQVVLYQMPEYLEGRDAPIYDEVDAIHRGLAARYRIPFLNYNTDSSSFLNYDKRNFWNWDHLSLEGAVIFSQRFARDLKRVLSNTSVNFRLRGSDQNWK